MHGDRLLAPNVYPVVPEHPSEFTVETRERLEFLDLTDELASRVEASGIRNGVAHLQSWLRLDQVPQQADAVIHLEQRARQADGTPVDTAWGAGRQRIAGCTGDGGPVQIG